MVYVNQLKKVEFRRHEYLAKANQVQQQIIRVEEGWAFQYAEASPGVRQITAFYLPGEYCEPEVFLSGKSVLPIKAITRVVASVIPLSGAHGKGGADVTDMLRAVLENSRRQTSLIVSLGRRSAAERLCYLTLNLYNRMQEADKVIDNRCNFPLTQQEIADATGMTSVHVNRVLHELGGRGIISVTDKTLMVMDLDALKNKAGRL